MATNHSVLPMFQRILFISLFCACFADTSEHPKPKRLRSHSVSTHPIVIVVSFDGFRYDYLNKVKASPWISALRSNGVSVPYMEPTFPTKTFPNHQSIATGLYAESHGIVDNLFFDPKYNTTLSGYKDDPGFWNYDPEVIPIWLLNEMVGDGRYSGCAMWPGSSQGYGRKNNLRPTHFYEKYNGSIPWEERVDTVISWITHDKKPANLIFLYHDEPDSCGHVRGPNSEETLREVEKADNRTSYLINKLIEIGVFDRTNLILLSDHGMKEVTQDNIIYLMDLLDAEDLLEAYYGSTPVLQLYPKEGKEEELYQNLTELTQDHRFQVWTKDNLSASPFHYSSSRRIADYVVVADAGFAFDDFNKTIAYYNKKWGFEANASNEYGVHGYSNSVASMRPFFIAHGPAFLKGYELAPIKNVDIVPLLCTILGLPEPPTNGSLERVKGMINPDYISQSSASSARFPVLNLLQMFTLIMITMEKLLL